MPEAYNEQGKWWEGTVAYQAYLRSVLDTNGDGIGDIKGVTQKLPYLEQLGIDAIWITPFYPSPMVDSGYDVSDYKAVDLELGNVADVKQLITEAHRRGIKIIVDLPANHTSDQHPWFEESRSSKNNPKRNWYTWHGGKDGGPPNNWLSLHGGSAWQLDEQSGQYYLHSFSVHQPDLNWNNREVRQAMHDIVNFWFDMGVDGLRVDAVSWLSKDPALQDDPLNPDYDPSTPPYHKLTHDNSCGGRELFNYLDEIADLCAERGDRFMITEAYPDVTTSARQQTGHYLQFYENMDPRYCAPFNFELLSSSWDAEQYRELIEDLQEALLPGQAQIYAVGNHDKSRLASRLGLVQARTAAVMLLSLPGMPFIYYGDELGMTDVKQASELVYDPETEQTGFNRHEARTPMQWSAEPNAGFSRAGPWLPVSGDYPEVNVAVQDQDPTSFLNLYKQLIKLRRSSEALSLGDCRTIQMHKDVLAYSRRYERDKKLVILNFSEQPTAVNSPEIAGRLLLTSYMDDHHADTVAGEIHLRSNEGVIIDVSGRA